MPKHIKILPTVEGSTLLLLDKPSIVARLGVSPDCFMESVCIIVRMPDIATTKLSFEIIK